jgi:hypothetical protein
MNKTELLLLILSVGMGLANVKEYCIDEEKFNAKYLKGFGTNLKDWLEQEKNKNLQERLGREVGLKDAFLAEWNLKKELTKTYVFVKKANASKDLDGFKRLEKEIGFYEKFKDDKKINQFLPEYYGCVLYNGNVFLII